MFVDNETFFRIYWRFDFPIYNYICGLILLPPLRLLRMEIHCFVSSLVSFLPLSDASFGEWVDEPSAFWSFFDIDRDSFSVLYMCQINEVTLLASYTVIRVEDDLGEEVEVTNDKSIDTATVETETETENEMETKSVAADPEVGTQNDAIDSETQAGDEPTKADATNSKSEQVEADSDSKKSSSESPPNKGAPPKKNPLLTEENGFDI